MASRGRDHLVQNILLPRRNRASAQPLVTWLGFHHAAFYQLKRMMQGVLARGTARSIANFAPYVAGKTGASDENSTEI
jgi:penicillin-binding protein 1A